MYDQNVSFQSWPFADFFATLFACVHPLWIWRCYFYLRKSLVQLCSFEIVRSIVFRCFIYGWFIFHLFNSWAKGVQLFPCFFWGRIIRVEEVLLKLVILKSLRCFFERSHTKLSGKSRQVFHLTSWHLTTSKIDKLDQGLQHLMVHQVEIEEGVLLEAFHKQLPEEGTAGAKNGAVSRNLESIFAHQGHIRKVAVIEQVSGQRISRLFLCYCHRICHSSENWTFTIFLAKGSFKVRINNLYCQLQWAGIIHTKKTTNKQFWVNWTNISRGHRESKCPKIHFGWWRRHGLTIFKNKKLQTSHLTH